MTGWIEVIFISVSWETAQVNRYDIQIKIAAWFSQQLIRPLRLLYWISWLTHDSSSLNTMKVLMWGLRIFGEVNFS